MSYALHRAQIQRPPAPPTLALVITSAAALTDPTPPSPPPNRAHVRDQQLLVLVELDPLHRGVLDPEQPSPYPAVAHAVPHPLLTAVRQPGNVDGERRVAPTTRSTHPRMRQESL